MENETHLWRDGISRPVPEHNCWPGGVVTFMSDAEMALRGLEPRVTDGMIEKVALPAAEDIARRLDATVVALSIIYDLCFQGATTDAIVDVAHAALLETQPAGGHVALKMHNGVRQHTVVAVEDATGDTNTH